MTTAAAIECPMCRTHYDEADGRVCHSGCPLQHGCQLLRCPSCGYEIPAPTRTTRWLSRWLGKLAASE